MRILSVVGARPNFMKLAPVDRELARRRDVEHVIVHTGQHYDPEMSDLFFEELWIPAPDYHLGVGSGSHAQQTAAVMHRLRGGHAAPPGERRRSRGAARAARGAGPDGPSDDGAVPGPPAHARAHPDARVPARRERRAAP